MKKEYCVYLWDKPAGKVQITREGLYCRISCRCTLPGDVICRLKGVSGTREESFGVLVPEDGFFGLTTRVSAKRLCEDMVFHAVPNRELMPGKFVPISPEEPFRYLERLKDAYLMRKNGQTGVWIHEKAGT